MAENSNQPNSVIHPTTVLGAIAPRSLDSFGVAGLLGEKAKVFYGSLFTTKHLGRVTDLIAAKLQKEGLDELRLRALLLFGTFEVFRAQSQDTAPEAVAQQRLAEPLVIECGLDADRIALGVSFTADENRFPKLAGLSERLAAGHPDGVFEELLAHIFAHSDHTVVRGQASIRRIEIVALLGIHRKIDPTALANKASVTVVEMGREQKADPPPVKAYIELGDLDYAELLKETGPGQGAAPPATGEVLVHGCTELEAAVRVRAADLLEVITRIKGSGESSNNDLVRVKGSPVEATQSVLVKGGQANETPGSETTVIKASPVSPPLATIIVPEPVASAVSPKYLAEKRGALANPKRELDETSEDAEKDDEPSEGIEPEPQTEDTEGESGDGDEGEDEEGGGDEEDSKIQKVIARVKSVWPFRFGGRRKAKDDEIEDDSDQISEVEVAKKKKQYEKPSDPSENEDPTDKDEPVVATEVSAVSPAQPIQISAGEIEKAAQKLTKEIETGLEETISRANLEATEVKKEMGSARAKRWVDGLMSELLAEKSRLGDASKALNSSIRQKELEFRNKEQMLTEELRRRDEMIRQKTNALSRAKDQLSQAAISAERLKSVRAGAADDAQYKQKYSLVQKMLTSAKDENNELAQKIDELKNQLMNVQLTSSKRNQPSMTDFTALQTKFERTLRQSEEFKKANQGLLDKLAEAKKERGNGAQDEVKKRLEAATKMSAGYQREAEKLQGRVEEMQREQMRLQADLNKANQDLRSARVASAKAQQQAITDPNGSAKAHATAVKAEQPKSETPAKPTATVNRVANKKPVPPKAA